MPLPASWSTTGCHLPFPLMIWAISLTQVALIIEMQLLNVTVCSAPRLTQNSTLPCGESKAIDMSPVLSCRYGPWSQPPPETGDGVVEPWTVTPGVAWPGVNVTTVGGGSS